MSATYISNELMKINSSLATHDALIDLGRQKELQELAKQKQEEDNMEIILFLDNYLINAIESGYFIEKSSIKYYSEKNISEIITKSSNHIKNLNTIINDKKTEYIKLLHENKEQQDENKELILQIDNLENDIENYWKKRTEKIRNICIQRNKTIKMLKYLIGFMISQQFLISYFGFYNYVDSIYITIKYTYLYSSTGISNIIYYIYMYKSNIISVLYLCCSTIILLISVINNFIWLVFNNIYNHNIISTIHYTNNSIDVCYL